MNILMIGELYKFGGASEIMEILAQRLEYWGHRVVLVFGYNYNEHKITDNHFVMYNNSFLRRLNNKFKYYFEKYNFINLYSELFIMNIIRRYNIDIVHFHAMQGGFLYMSTLEKICRKNNVVWTVHDTWPITGGCMYYWNCKQWKNKECAACKNKDLWGEYFNAKINLQRKKIVLQKKNIHFVAPSEWMLENLMNSIIKNEKLLKIENGINLEIFKPLTDIVSLKEKYKINKYKRVLMFNAGSVMNKYKGWKYLQKALKNLKNRQNYELLIIGKQVEDIGSLNISTKIMGYIEDKYILNELYNIADIFILPSLQDNFPTVTLEAQAAGTPVLAFEIGGIKEQISDETGWLIKNICSDSLSHNIEDIFENNNWKLILSHKGEKARQRSELLYDEKLMTKRYEKVYREKVDYAKSQRFYCKK